MVEEVIWDDVVTCDHSYDKRCHTTYKTSFDSVQEEECEENFRKTCFITMVDTAMNVTTNVCKKPMVKDCDIEGEPICRTEYQSECWSKQIPHEVEDDVAECVTVQDRMCKEETSGYTTQEKCEDWPRQECTVVKKKVTKYTTMTGCNKEPTELCAPVGCGFTEREEECHDVVKTHIQEKPEEGKEANHQELVLHTLGGERAAEPLDDQNTTKYPPARISKRTLSESQNFANSTWNLKNRQVQF